MKTKAVRVSRTVLLEHLADSIRFLRRSCEAFDAGDESEGRRIAVQLRVLLHDSPNAKSKSRSLLSQLPEFRWRFVASQVASFDVVGTDNAIPSYNGLVAMSLTTGPPPGARFQALCASWNADRPLPLQDFRVWWHDVIFRDRNWQTYTRRQLVLAAADQDGGAHVDAELEAVYAGLLRDESLGWSVFCGDERRPWPNNPIMPSLRQMGHEVLMSLEAQGLK